jgi:hypothetical protein
VIELQWEKMDWGAWRVRGLDGLIEVDPKGSQWRWRVYQQGGGSGVCDTLAEAQVAALLNAVELRERALAGFAALLVKTKAEVRA